MPVPFNHLGLFFKFFPVLFYSRRARLHLRRSISRVETGFVIDLGGGTGTLLNLAHSIRPDLIYLCVDPAMGMLKYVRPYAYRVAARSEDLPFSDSTIAAILIGDALHHFSDPVRGLKEVFRVLKPGGKLFIYEIDPESFLGWLAIVTERPLREHTNFYPPEQLQELLSEIGFVVVEQGRGRRYTIDAEKAHSSMRYCSNIAAHLASASGTIEEAALAGEGQ